MKNRVCSHCERHYIDEGACEQPTPTPPFSQEVWSMYHSPAVSTEELEAGIKAALRNADCDACVEADFPFAHTAACTCGNPKHAFRAMSNGWELY